MSNARIPSSLPPPSDAAARAVREDTGGKQTVRLVSLPERLYDVQKAAILRGEVVRQDADGTIRLASSEGEITVRAEKPDQFTPGEHLEIRIPPGRPPKSAEVRPAPPERPKTRGTQTDVDVKVSQRESNSQNESQDTLSGRVVRVVPLNLAEALQALESPADVEQVVTSTPNPVPTPAAQPLTTDLAPVTAETLKQLISIKVAKVVQTVVQTSLPDTFTQRPESFQALANATLTLPQGTEIGRILKGVLGLAPNGLQTPLLPAAEPPLESLRPTPNSFQVGDLSLPPLDSVLAPFDPLAPLSLSSLPKDEAALSELASRFPPAGLRAGEAAAQVLGAVSGKDALAVAVVFPAKADGQVQFFALLEPGVRLTPGSLIELSPLPLRVATSQNAVSPALSPVTAVPIAPVTLSTLPLGLPYFLTAETWPALQDIAHLLPQVSPQIAQAFTNMIPNPATPQQMAPAALFFIAAMRSGDIEGWLGGRAVDALRRAGRADIIGRLSQESSVLSRMSAEPLGQEWKATSLPLFWQGEIFKLPLYYKGSGEERGTGQERGNSMIRFIINLDLSRMGKIQMDALYREQARRFDMILRSSQAFSKAAEYEMRGIFSSALEDIGLRGDMGFQSGADKWVTVQPDKLYEFSQSF